MKPNDIQLERLLKAAGRAPIPGEEEIPLGLESRVIAHWRLGAAEEDPAFLFTFMRRALVGAATVLIVCAAWSLMQPVSDAAADGYALASFERQAGFNP
jgi:hypothetical protein